MNRNKQKQQQQKERKNESFFSINHDLYLFKIKQKVKNMTHNVLNK